MYPVTIIPSHHATPPNEGTPAHQTLSTLVSPTVLTPSPPSRSCHVRFPLLCTCWCYHQFLHLKTSTTPFPRAAHEIQHTTSSSSSGNRIENVELATTREKDQHVGGGGGGVGGCCPPTYGKWRDRQPHTSPTTGPIRPMSNYE